jgi:WD40 repeat protein
MAGKLSACWMGWLIVAISGAHASVWGQAQADDKAAPAAAARPVETVEIKPEPFKLKPGSPLSDRALVTKPGAVRGVLSWTLETRRHRGAIFHSSLSPDGKSLATGGLDGTVRLWEVATGRLVRALVGHPWYVYQMAWSPDGRTLATIGANEPRVRLWDVQTGMLLRSIVNDKGYVARIAWSPDGKRLAMSVAASGYMYVHDAATGVRLNNAGLGTPVTALAWSPDGLVVAYAGPQSPVQLWELSQTNKGDIIEVTGDTTYSLAWSPDGKTIAVGGVASIRLFDFAERKLLRTLTSQGYALEWSPDGKRLASATNNSLLQLWDDKSDKPVQTFAGSTVTSLNWSADGQLIGTANQTTAAVWEVSSGTVRQKFDAVGLYPPVWSPGKPLVMGSQTKKLSVWDGNSGKRVCELEGHTNDVLSLAWKRDGKTLASGASDNTVRLWDIPSGNSLAVLAGHKGPVYSLAFAPDGKTLASGSTDSTIRLWKSPDRKSSSSKTAGSDSKADSKAGTDAAAGAIDVPGKSANASAAPTPDEGLIRTLEGHKGPVLSLSWMQNGKMLASGASDKTVRLWTINPFKLNTTIDSGVPASAVGWSPDGKVVCSSGVEYHLRTYSPARGEAVVSFGAQQQRSATPISSVAWSPNGAVVAAGYAGQHAINLWDIASPAKPIRSLTTYAPVLSVTWTTGGSTIAAGCQDRTIRFFDAATGLLRGYFIGEENNLVALSVDGFFRSEPVVESELFYVVQTEKTQDIVSLSDFATKFKWKNVPTQVKVMGN